MNTSRRKCFYNLCLCTCCKRNNSQYVYDYNNAIGMNSYSKRPKAKCKPSRIKKNKFVCNKKLRLAGFVLVAQIVAFSSSASGLFSNYIVDHGLNIPIFQGLFVYILLCLLWAIPSTRYLGAGKNASYGTINLPLESSAENSAVSEMTMSTQNESAQNQKTQPQNSNTFYSENLNSKSVAIGEDKNSGAFNTINNSPPKKLFTESNNILNTDNEDFIGSSINNPVLITNAKLFDNEKTINDIHDNHQLPGKMNFEDEEDFILDNWNNNTLPDTNLINEIKEENNNMNDEEISISNTDQQIANEKIEKIAKKTVKIGYAILPADYILLILAASFDTVGNVCAVKAYQYTTVASAQLLQCLNTPITFFSCWLFYSVSKKVCCSKATRWFRLTFTKPVINEILSTMLAFIGTIVFSCLDSLLKNNPDDDEKSSLDRAIGDILAMLAGIGYGMATTINEALMNRYTFLQYLARIAPVNVFLLGILSLSIEIDEIRKIDNYTIGMISGFTIVIILLYFGGVYTVEKTSGLFYTLNMLTSNIYGFIFSIFVFHQKFNPYIIIGIAIILAGLFWYIFASNKKERSERLKGSEKIKQNEKKRKNISKKTIKKSKKEKKSSSASKIDENINNEIDKLPRKKINKKRLMKQNKSLTDIDSGLINTNNNIATKLTHTRIIPGPMDFGDNNSMPDIPEIILTVESNNTIGTNEYKANSKIEYEKKDNDLNAVEIHLDNVEEAVNYHDESSSF